MTANRAGWTTSTRSVSRRARRRRRGRTSSRCQSMYGSSASRRLVERRRRRPVRCRSSSLPMPAHWEPWPGKTNTVSRVRRGVPRRGRAWRSPVGQRVQAGQQLVAVGADDHRAVLEACVRVMASDRPRSAGRRPGAVVDVGAAAARPARAAPVLAAGRQQPRAAGAPAVRPSVRLRTAGRGRLLEDDVGVGAADAERRHRRPARPVRSAARAGPRSAARPRRPTSRRAGTARRRAACAGSTPCRSAITILMTPPTPAAAWVCPMFDLSEPSHSGRSAGRSWP